jgi:hypothetical protein
LVRVESLRTKDEQGQIVSATDVSVITIERSERNKKERRKEYECIDSQGFNREREQLSAQAVPALVAQVSGQF